MKKQVSKIERDRFLTISKIYKALAKGRQIQCRIKGAQSKWVDVDSSDLNWREFEYRVKPGIVGQFLRLFGQTPSYA